MIPAFTACLYEQFVTAQEDRLKAAAQVLNGLIRALPVVL
jgi:hypothetical protein